MAKLRVAGRWTERSIRGVEVAARRYKVRNSDGEDILCSFTIPGECWYVLGTEVGVQLVNLRKELKDLEVET